MFDSNSRYVNIPTGTWTTTDADGAVRQVRYVLRRFLPGSAGQTTLVEHTVTQGERLDNITARYINDPTQFWRVCDANDVMRPGDLEEIGRVIAIALPGI